MKLMKQTSLKFMMLLVFICSTLLFGTSTLAATKTITLNNKATFFKNKDENTFFDKIRADYNVSYEDLFKADPKPTDLKSSNTNVMSVKLVKLDGENYIKFTTKGVGTAKVSYKYTYKNKTYKVVETYKVHKYVNPLAVLKIGNTDLKSKFASSHFGYAKRDMTGILTIKPASGWKIVDMYQQKGINSNTVKIKNNQKISIKKNIYTSFTFYNVKGDYYEYLYLDRY